MQTSTSASKNTGKGPRACTTCARAKARCIPGPDVDICERCHRLQKSCSQQTPAPPRRRKEPKPTRVAELERRLGALTARLDAAAGGISGGSSDMGAPGRTPPDSLGNSPQEGQDISVDDGRCGQGSCSPEHGPGDTHPNEIADWWSQQKGNSAALTTSPRPGSGTRMPFRIGHLFPADSHDAAPTPPSDRSYYDRAREASWDGTAEIEDEDDEDGKVKDRNDSPNECWRVPSVANGLRSQPMDFLVPSNNNLCSPAKGPPGPLWPEPEEAAALLNEYQAHMAPVFPFVALPSGLTAMEMRKQRPFVWKAVMMAACRLDGRRQIVLGNTLLREIMGASFLRPQKGLDLLQALQLLLAWLHYNLNSFQTTNLLFLMRSLSTGMGLTEGVAEDAPTAKRHSLEQLRAFLGTYYLITLTFTTNKKADALLSTGYLDVACDALHARMEYPGDELAMYLVKIQLLAQSIYVAMAPRKEHGLNAMPLAMVVKSFQEQIDAYRNSLPEHLQDNITIIQHTHVCEILLFDTSILDKHPIYFFNPAERLELLWSCLRAVRGFLAVRFLLDAPDLESYAGEPVFLSVGSFEFLYALSTAFKLIMLTTSTPGWDPARALDIEGVMDRLIRSMKAIAAKRSTRRRYTQGEIPGTTQDPFDRLTKRIIDLGQCLCKVVISKPNVVPVSVVGAARAIPSAASCETIVVGEQQSQPFAAEQPQQYQQFTPPELHHHTQYHQPEDLQQQQHHIQQHVQGSEHLIVSPQNDPHNLWTGDDVDMLMDLDNNFTEWAPYFTQASFGDFPATGF